MLSGESERAAPDGFHVALDLDLARLCPTQPGAVLVNGFLLFDCGGYELCTARLPALVFWRMKAIDMLGRSRWESEPPLDATGVPPASVWQVEGRLRGPVQGSLAEWNRAGGMEDLAVEHGSGGGERIYLLDVERVLALDRVWLDKRGPRLVEAHIADAILPGLRS